MGLTTSSFGNPLDWPHREVGASTWRLCLPIWPTLEPPTKWPRSPPTIPMHLRWPQPVHRLDRVTSGWVCVALNLRTASSIGAAFAAQRIRKSYLALVAGDLDGQGECRLPLEGQTAHTSWNAIASGPLPVHGTATLLRVLPTTGRTHQIRRHCALLGHPIVGEDRYPERVDTGEEPLRYKGNGLFLSAVELHIPAGEHGASSRISADAPKKFRRIAWVKNALSQDQATDAS